MHDARRDRNFMPLTVRSQKAICNPGCRRLKTSSMRFPLSVVAAAAVLGLLSGCGTTKKIVQYVPFVSKPAPAQAGVSRKRTRNLALKMEIVPLPVRLSDARQFEVRIRLENISRKFVQLQFPTSQRIELLVRDDTGKTIVKWSEDRLFENVVGYVGINPGEHVEYSANIPTRDLGVGRKYVVTGFFPSFGELKAETTIVPEA